MDFFYYILALVLTGIGIGFTTGLLGVGGGFLLVPILFFLLQSIGIDSTIAIRLSFGTSLAIILFTAISSAYGHYRKNQVEVKAAIYFGISGFLGSLIGGYAATQMPEDILRLIFGFIILFVAIQLLFLKNLQMTWRKKKNSSVSIFRITCRPCSWSSWYWWGHHNHTCDGNDHGLHHETGQAEPPVQ